MTKTPIYMFEEYKKYSRSCRVNSVDRINWTEYFCFPDLILLFFFYISILIFWNSNFPKNGGITQKDRTLTPIVNGGRAQDIHLSEVQVRAFNTHKILTIVQYQRVSVPFERIYILDPNHVCFGEFLVINGNRMHVTNYFHEFGVLGWVPVSR